jgi:hypothetical protein
MLAWRLVFSILIWVLCAHPAWPQMFAAVTELGHAADLVVVATVDSIAEPGGLVTPDVAVRIHVVNVWKGSAPSETLLAGVPALSRRAPGPIALSNARVGKTGVWFLKSGTPKYQILPRLRFTYSPGDLFLPLPDGASPELGTSPLDDRLMAFIVQWYQSLEKPGGMLDDSMLLLSFERWHADGATSPQAFSVLEPLIHSSSPTRRLAGLAAAMRAGSLDAMTLAVAEAPVLQSNPRFSLIVSAIGECPKDASWLAPLQRLAALHLDIPGVDIAVVAALRTIGTKAVLPGMAEELDSKDPKAQLGAASYFGVFTLLANAQGEILPSAPIGPFATPDTRAYTPRAEKPTTPSEYAQFWKAWWAGHRAHLGFPAP